MILRDDQGNLHYIRTKEERAIKVGLPKEASWAEIFVGEKEAYRICVASERGLPPTANWGEINDSRNPHYPHRRLPDLTVSCQKG